jgi:hypothetical protein
VPPWLSDSLCRLATGGGHAARKLYTNDEETLVDAQRPVILNGIEQNVTRADLGDRSISITLEPIPPECRISERELWSRFEQDRGAIFGALLDMMAYGLRALPTRIAKNGRFRKMGHSLRGRRLEKRNVRSCFPT